MGTQHLRVPYGLIRALCYGGGYRLPQQVSRVRPPEPEVDAVNKPYFPTSQIVSKAWEIVRPVYPAPVVTVEGPEASAGSDIRWGNLSNEAYKFFKGSIIRASNYYQCRGCMTDEYVIERRALHMRECRQLMQAIEERIKRDRVCVICNLSTSRERWRIPLCSEACVTKWRFVIPEPWAIARRFVLAAEPHLLRTRCESTPTNS